MSFKENLRQKMRIDRLTRQVLQSFGAPRPVDGIAIIDKGAMRMLLQTAGYKSRTERETEMYARDFSKEKNEIIVLDNELKVYDTSVPDVLLRKNPITKEMISIRNIRKILNDHDVVISRGPDTVRKIRRRFLEGLDLTYTPEDINAIHADGVKAIERNDVAEIVETLDFFAEILGMSHPPLPARIPDLEVYGWETLEHDQAAFGPVYIYLRSENSLRKFDLALTSLNMYKPDPYRDMAHGKEKPDLEDGAVFDDLREKVRALSRDQVPIEE